LLVGLLPAVLYFLGMVRDSIEDEFLSLVAILLIGPIACAFYFLIEQVAHRLRRDSGAPNNSLEREAAKPRASG